MFFKIVVNPGLKVLIRKIKGFILFSPDAWCRDLPRSWLDLVSILTKCCKQSMFLIMQCSWSFNLVDVQFCQTLSMILLFSCQDFTKILPGFYMYLRSFQGLAKISCWTFEKKLILDATKILFRSWLCIVKILHKSICSRCMQDRIFSNCCNFNKI